MAQKPTLAYIDHISHKDTGSNLFLKNALKDHFEITDFWVNPWGHPRVIPVETLNTFDHVLFFQRINPFRDLAKITANMTWVAMYDSLSTDPFYWRVLQTVPIKILCFAEKLQQHCNSYGLRSHFARYYPDPEKLTRAIPTERRKKAFFWYRDSVRFSDIKKILDPHDIESLTYRISSLPEWKYKEEQISKNDIDAYHISFNQIDFAKDTSEQYLGVLKNHPIFIAPRVFEGIGLSVIEALASGHCVIANDDATLNEYIQDGVNGIIVDYKHPKKISLAGWETLAENARVHAQKGYEKWTAAIPGIIRFMQEKTSPTVTSPFSVTIRRMLYNLKYRAFEAQQEIKRRSQRTHR